MGFFRGIIKWVKQHIPHNIFVGIKGPEMDIGPWAMSKNKQTLMRTYKLVSYGRSLVTKDRDCSPRRNTSSVKHSKGQRSNLLSRTTH